MNVKFEKRAGLERMGHYYVSNDGRQVLQSYLRSQKATGLFKKATVGSGGNEAGFEQAFSSLAYAYMKDKAPRLLDFLVGFQLVDRNEDNTKAMGMFGFKVGDQWLYAPVFFLNGDLKGHELLYIKKQDSFVPMKENWVNYLMSRKPHILGEGSPQDTYQLGGRQPDFGSLSNNPANGIGKYGSDMQKWVRPALPLVAAVMAKSAKALYKEHVGNTKLAFDAVIGKPQQAAMVQVAAKVDLNQILPSSFALLKSAFEISRMSPAIKRGFDRFYGPDCFTRWGQQIKGAQLKRSDNLLPRVKQAEVKHSVYTNLSDSIIPEAPLPEHPIKSGALQIHTTDDHAIARNLEQPDETGKEQLSQDDLADLQQNGYLIKDERKGEEISKAYNTQVEQSLSNPHESGIWEVLEKPGKFSKMLVIVTPQSNQGNHEFCTLVRLSDNGKKAWLNVHRSAVWARKVEDKAEFESWFKGLGDRDSLQEGGVYLAINDNGSGTPPFRVSDSYGEGHYSVDFRMYYDRDETNVFSVKNRHTYDPDVPSSYDVSLQVDSEHRQGTKLRAIGGGLRVPGRFKFLQLKPPRAADNACCGCEGGDGSGDADEVIVPGKISDLQMLFTEKTARMKVFTDHHEVSITSPLGNQRMNKQAAFLSLVRDHGFTEHVAGCILKQAEAKTQKVFRVAYAPGFGDKRAQVKSAYALSGGPNAPAFPEPQVGIEMLGGRTAVNASYPDEQHIPVDELDSGMYDPGVHDLWSNYTHEDFQRTMRSAQQAAQSGQKEIFDTAMIGNMLKTVRQDSLVDKHLGDLLSALDKLGRILLLFYWHQEEFEDRYGKADLPELEDSLRNAFEVLGDVVIFLKEKTVETDFSDIGDLDIEEAARN